MTNDELIMESKINDKHIMDIVNVNNKHEHNLRDRYDEYKIVKQKHDKAKG